MLTPRKLAIGCEMVKFGISRRAGLVTRFLEKITYVGLLLDSRSEILQEKNSTKLRPWIANMYLLVHYVLGFFMLWLTKDNLDKVNNSASGILISGSIETAWLIAGVAWGNVGWDVSRSILKNGTIRSSIVALLKTTLPMLTLLPGIIYNIQIYHGWFSGGLLYARYYAIEWMYLAPIILIMMRGLRWVVSRAERP